MTKKTEIWMPIYIGDYLGDTQRLTTEQHGAYLLLILDYWRNGPPPDNDDVLRQITRLDARAWTRHRGVISGLFKITSGVWRHKRVDEELAKAEINQDKRTDRAKKGAKARWGKAKNDATSKNQALPADAPSPSPSPSPDEVSKDTPSVKRAKSKAIEVADRPDDVTPQVWDDFIRLRKKKGAPVTDTVLSRIRAEADKAGWTMENALAECVTRGWQGFKADWVAKEDRNGRPDKKSGWDW